MSPIGSVAFAPSPGSTGSATDALSVATALASLRLNPGTSVAISDSRANIEANLDALQRVAARVSSLVTTDTTAQLSVSAAEYAKNTAILAKWGATDGNTVDVTGVAAADAATFATERASWVSTFTVTDSSANLAKRLDSLQSLVAAGSLRQIVRTGTAAPLRITTAQLNADAGALAAIKNGAYTLAITDATVGNTLGLGGASALTGNAKIASIHIKDTTAEIQQNLDALQRVGLKLKSIAQTDASTSLTVSASQLKNDAIAIGKILTPYHLDVIRASAAQAAKLAANTKVLTLSVSDTAANIAKSWALLDRVSDSLTAVEVTDPSNALKLTGDQVQGGDDVLAKFTADADHAYSLEVTGVRAGQVAKLADVARVASLSVADTADKVAANLDALEAVQSRGLLGAIRLQGESLNVSLDAARMVGDAATATQSVLGKISNLNYGVAVAGASIDNLDALAANERVASIALAASSDEIETHLDTFAQLGRRLSRIRQTDSGAAISVTQTAFDRRAGVLAKIEGGYSVEITGASVEQAIADAANSRVASISVADTGRNLSLHWRALRTMGSVLTAVARTDSAAITVLASGYQLARNDGLLAKFAADQHFEVANASVDQAQELAGDAAIDRIGLVEDGSVVAARMSDVADLVSGGKLRDITLNAGASRVALQANQLGSSQSVLDLVNDGRYTLALSQVDIADLSSLLAGNSKIASVQVNADAAGIVANLDALAAAGAKLSAITRTDDAEVALALTGADFDSHRAELAKISGGYLAELTSAAASRASSLAGDAHVKSLAVSDTGANLSSNWNALAGAGAKLTGIAQSDTASIDLGAAQWARTQSLGEKFSTSLGVSISGATLADLEALDSSAAVKSIQLSDSAPAISAAWSTLAANTKLSALSVFNPATALTMSAATYADSTALRNLITGGQYTVALSDASVADAATLDADTHVASFDSSGSSGDISAAFDTLAGLAKLQTIALTDANGTLSLSAAQILGHAATLAKISNGHQIAATEATMANLPGLQAVQNLASINVSDTAAQVAGGLTDLVTLGGVLNSIHLTDSSPVLALTQADWSAASSALTKIDGSYGVNLSQVDAATVASTAAETSVQQIAVAGTAESVAQNWDALVAAYAAGSGKLSAISLSDSSPLSLTTAQQSDGAAMLAALLPGATIVSLD